MSKKIQAPTPGRIVLVRLRPDTVRPGIVYIADDVGSVNVEHFGPSIELPSGRRISGDLTEVVPGTYYAEDNRCMSGVRYGTLDDGAPALGCWCWPPMSRAEIDVPK